MNIVIHIPNALTILRGLLTPLVAWLLFRSDYSSALWIFAFAGSTDWLDGFLARRFRLSTHLGAFLDPVADKLLMVTSFVALGLLRLLPLWMVALVVLRDFVIVSGSIAFWRISGSLAMEPLYESKLNTCCQVLLVVGTIAGAAALLPGGWWQTFLLWCAACTTIVSGVRYVWVWSHKLPSAKSA